MTEDNRPGFLKELEKLDEEEKHENAAIAEEERLLDNWFTYPHPPTTAQQDNHKHIREAARDFAEAIFDNTPKCADQTAALRKVREAMMTANAAIACKGK